MNWIGFAVAHHLNSEYDFIMTPKVCFELKAYLFITGGY
jgi:hypothetical protein